MDEVTTINERGQSKWYHIRVRKFNRGLLVFREDVTIEKQAEEKIMQLNRALFSKNKERVALTSELKTLTVLRPMIIMKRCGYKASGIGLAICKKVMDLHGGFIASELAPECTTFKCYFPIQKGSSAA